VVRQTLVGGVPLHCEIRINEPVAST